LELRTHSTLAKRREKLEWLEDHAQTPTIVIFEVVAMMVEAEAVAVVGLTTAIEVAGAEVAEVAEVAEDMVEEGGRI
jgi:hypothetical protein